MPAVGLSATTLAFGDQMLGTASAARSVSISNTGTANLVLGTIVTTGTNASEFAPSKCSGSTLTPGASCAVDATFTPAALNARSATLSIRPTPAAAARRRTVRQWGGRTRAGSHAEPGQCGVRQSDGGREHRQADHADELRQRRARHHLDRRQRQRVHVEHNCAATLAAAASSTINVTFTPTAAVASTGAVTVTSAAAGSPHTVGLSGTGTAPTPLVPVATLAPVAVDFGSVTLNTPSTTRAVSLSNTGNAPLKLSAVNLGGANASEFSQTHNCPVGGALAAGASCSISAELTPAATGTRAATLTLTSDAAGSPAVDLKGTGMVQASALAQVAPSQANFGSVRVGKTSDERKIRVRNTGTSPLLISSVSVTGDFVYESDCKATLAAGKSCEMNVKFKPSAVGARTGELSVGSNAAGAPHVVKLSGTGVIRASREEEDCDDEDKCGQSMLPFTRRKKD